MKPGIKSTEFWVILLVALASFIGTVQEILPAEWAAGATSAMAALYALSRGIAKFGDAISNPHFGEDPNSGDDKSL
ncbi:MAG: hypothetical protein Unbinned3891contig1000_76 [Prokaryotic dsDNA virus sp.]|nr:MAG: hypothetical protein Unbinned3891contig1000_76 [Prokaryotic dsDNA virus sp.]|tara:strand:- start:49133 stop:49360 length:228 start_codon:yes stop_codon:yes gene_type:complete